MNSVAEMSLRHSIAFSDPVNVAYYGSGNGLPAFITPRDQALAHEIDAAAAWLRNHEEVLNDFLTRVGAFVLRGFAFHKHPISPKRDSADPFWQMGKHFEYAADPHAADNTAGQLRRMTLQALANLRLFCRDCRS